MFKKQVLDNGLRVILAPQKGSLAVTVMILVEAGSKYEKKELNGISHFLEHMVFKGTKKRPNAFAISSELDGIGAQYNAFTSQEYTGYYAKVKNEFFDRAFDVVSDLYLNPVFPELEIEKEKGVIIEEINMYEDLPQRKVQEVFMECAYGDQPAGWSVAGQKDVIKKIKQKDFIGYRLEHYLPQSTVVVVSGGFSETEALKEIENRFAELKTARKGAKIKVNDTQEKPQEIVRFKNSDQTHLILGFRAFSVFDKRKFALRVLGDILGGSMSSRLFQKIREEMSAAYYVSAAPDFYSDHGLFSMAAGVQHEKAEIVLRAAIEEFGLLTKELVKEEELRRTKDHLIGTMFLSLETSDEIGYFYGSQEIAGLPIITPEQAVKEIEAVSAEEVRKTAQFIFKENRLNLALIGPFKKKSFLNFLKI